METFREWRLRALTPIWTGSVAIESERERIVNERAVSTGLLGSLRWWFEVLVRGLGSSACDPSEAACQDRQHCVVCELFGCTGWARKFRFQILAGTEGDTVQGRAIARDTKFRLRFQPLRDIAPEEWALLDLTLRLISDYGAIGGKTVLKPSDEPSRGGERHHQDYGIIALEKRPQMAGVAHDHLEVHVRNVTWRSVHQGHFAWASLRNFWCVNGRHLARQSANASVFNRVIGREEEKARGQQLRNNGVPANQWLAGRQGESKKVFSFKNPPRTFGFVNPPTVALAQIKRRLKQAWPDLKDDEILPGDLILDRLLSGGEAT